MSQLPDSRANPFPRRSALATLLLDDSAFDKVLGSRIGGRGAFDKTLRTEAAIGRIGGRGAFDKTLRREAAIGRIGGRGAFDKTLRTEAAIGRIGGRGAFDPALGKETAFLRRGAATESPRTDLYRRAVE